MRFLKLPAVAPSPLGYCYLLLCLLMPVVPLFNVHALVPIIAVIALGVLVIAWRNGDLQTIKAFDRWLAAAICGYICAMVIASIGTDFFLYALRSIAKFAGVVLMAAILVPMQSHLTDADRVYAFIGLLIAVTLTSGWILIDVLSGGAISSFLFGFDLSSANQSFRLTLYGYFWYKSASTILVVMALILGIYLKTCGNTVFALCIAALASITADQIGSRSAAYGLVIAMTLGVIFHLLGRFRVKATVTILAITFLMPFWMSAVGFSPKGISAELNPTYNAAHSVAYRMHIWDFTAGKIAEKPLLGWGAGASKRLGTDEQGILSDPVFGPFGEPIPGHPHNGILQVWLEYGLLGAISTFLLIVRALVIADRRATRPGTRIWVFSTVALIACFFGFNFSISSSWWLTSIAAFIAIGMTFLNTPKQRETS